MTVATGAHRRLSLSGNGVTDDDLPGDFEAPTGPASRGRGVDSRRKVNALAADIELAIGISGSDDSS
jgi:hypothetical protein